MLGTRGTDCSVLPQFGETDWQMHMEMVGRSALKRDEQTDGPKLKSLRNFRKIQTLTTGL